MRDDDERAEPSALGRGGKVIKASRRILLYSGLGIALVGYLVYRGDPAPSSATSSMDSVISAATGKWGDMTRRDPPPDQPAAAAAPPAQPQPPAMPADTAMPGREGKPRQRRYVSYAPDDAVVRADGQRAGQGGAAGANAPASSPAPSAPPAAAPGAAPGQTTVAYGATTFPGRRASAPMDNSLVMVPGLYAMTLDTPINTERGGPFFAHLPRDIRSPSGVVLMEKDTPIQGVISTGMTSGQGRVALVAASALTANGVWVPLGEMPVGDNTGRTGVPGVIQSNLWPRLQGAVILMATQGAFQAASAALQSSLAQRGSTSFNLNTGGIESAVAEAVRGGAAIQNSADIEAGKELTFYVTQPITFEDSYSLQTIDSAPPVAARPRRAAR